MRIAFILIEFPSLSQTFILNQIVGLIERGHEVDIYADTRGPDAGMHAEVEEHDLLSRTIYLPRMPRNRVARVAKGLGLVLLHGWRNPAAMLHASSGLCRVIQHLGRRRYDVVHCHFGPTGLDAVRLKKIGLIRDPILTSFHGYDANVLPAAKGEGYYDPLFAVGDLCTANSGFLRRKLVALGAREDQVVTLACGVNLAKFPLAERRLEKGSPVRVLTVGRLVEVKGVEYGIRAIAKAVTRCPEIRYDIAGSGPLRGSLEKLAQDLGVEDRVRFLGAVDHTAIRELCAQSHVFLLPGVIGSDGAEEAQGLVLLEAQAAGLPVVASRVGGVPENVLDGRSGFLVPQRDPDAIAEKLCYLAEHPEVWPQMGRAGREYVEEHFDLHKLNDRLIEIYQELAARKPRAG